MQKVLKFVFKPLSEVTTNHGLLTIICLNGSISCQPNAENPQKWLVWGQQAKILTMVECQLQSRFVMKSKCRSPWLFQRLTSMLVRVEENTCTFLLAYSCWHPTMHQLKGIAFSNSATRRSWSALKNLGHHREIRFNLNSCKQNPVHTSYRLWVMSMWAKLLLLLAV